MVQELIDTFDGLFATRQGEGETRRANEFTLNFAKATFEDCESPKGDFAAIGAVLTAAVTEKKLATKNQIRYNEPLIAYFRGVHPAISKILVAVAVVYGAYFLSFFSSQAACTFTWGEY